MRTAPASDLRVRRWAIPLTGVGHRCPVIWVAGEGPAMGVEGHGDHEAIGCVWRQRGKLEQPQKASPSAFLWRSTITWPHLH